MLKEKAKLNEKMNLKMIIRDDDGPREETEEGMFLLKDIQNAEDLEALQDVAPDALVQDDIFGREAIPKFTKYEKSESYLDDDGNVNNKMNDDDVGFESTDESDLGQTGLGLSDDENNEDKKSKKKITEKEKTSQSFIKTL